MRERMRAMPDVTMPRLSDTMEEGKILRWLKREGDRVEAGELLVEVETDKADMEVESSEAGVLKQVKLAEGETAPVGAVIAVIEAGDGESTGSTGNGRSESPPQPREGTAKPAAPPSTAKSGVVERPAAPRTAAPAYSVGCTAASRKKSCIASTPRCWWCGRQSAPAAG